MHNTLKNNDLFLKIAQLLQAAKQNIVRHVNQTMVYTYYEIGKMIVEDEQQGKQRAEYGKQVLSDLSTRLTRDFGKGFSMVNLRQMRSFYLTYSIQQTTSAKLTLSWSHYLKLMRIENADERRFYEIECTTNNWSLKELQRQFDAALYERLALSRDKDGIKQLAEQGQIVEKPTDILKDPYILEFLDLPEKYQYSENDLETAIIDKLEHFLLELGKGFTFVARQFRMTIDDEHFRADLVFFNRLLRCFVVIDLKIGKLTHQDLGQMQMYVNYHDRFVKLPDENKTIGIVLCKQKSDVLVEITLPKDNEQIFARQYQTVLPDKQSFINLLIENEK